MIRRIFSAAVVSTLAVSVVACSAAPSSEGESAGESALAIQCTSPLTAPVAYVDDGELGKRGKVSWSCDYVPSPSIRPAGGYPEGAIVDCSPATAVRPPANLASCTWGWRLWSNEGYGEVFLCPTSLTPPPGASNQPGSWDDYALFPDPSNGCFGEPSDPSYRYVIHSLTNGSPANCGGSCGHF